MTAIHSSITNRIPLSFTFRSDMKALVLALARCSTDDVNATVSARDLRTSMHLACAMGNLAMAQLLIWVSCQKKNQNSLLHQQQSNYFFSLPRRITPTSNKLTTRDVLVYHMPKRHCH